MSGFNLYVWDAAQGIPRKESDLLIVSEIPPHDTDANNYQHFMQVIDDFIADADKQYPEMDYMGHHLLNHAVSIEPIPIDIYSVYLHLLIETAVNNGLCLYDIENGLYTPDDKADYPLGEALKQWEAQKQSDKERQALIEQSDYVVPESAKEMKQLINKILKERLEQAGIKNIKKYSYGYYADFGETQMRLDLDIEAYTGELTSSIGFYANVIEYIENNCFYLRVPSLRFNDVYEIPQEYLTVFKKYEIQSYEEIPTEIHRAIDTFIDAYPHVQSLSDLYHYFSNPHGERKLSRRFIRNKVCEPILYKTLVALAKLCNPEYPSLRDKYREEWIAWEIKSYYFRKKAYEDREESYFQANNKYKKIPYDDTIEGDVEAVITERVDADLADIDGLNVEEILAMDLPAAFSKS